MIEDGAVEEAGAGGVSKGPMARRILVTDDNIDAAETLADVLDHWGHRVRIASDGSAALDMAREHLPHVVILDIAMPLMDGWECARRLRAMGELEGVLLIALTGFGGKEDRQRSAEAGFDHHLTKPPDLETLRKLINLI